MIPTQLDLSLSHPAERVIIIIIDIFAAVCAYMETLLLWVFGVPSTTTSRLFAEIPERTAIAGLGSVNEELEKFALAIRLSGLLALAVVPYLASLEATIPSKMLVGRLVDPLTRRNKRAAFVIMLARMWLAMSIRNAIWIHCYQVDSFRLEILTTPFIFLLI
ncbi:hypothetical protein GGR52DRAFT_531752 [Hypoxylon sp. FL1284]|nr:hypothetical protein GGR52DRAFT_531752 [Hypoxylon sp. FL1284]